VGSLLHDGYGWTASNMLAGKANHFSICLQVAWLMREKNKLHKNTQTHKTDQTSELIKQMASCDLGLFRGIFGRRDDNAMFPSHGAYMWVIRPGSCQ
jgi:tetrahydromethanopterin S-methyltransferase subunit H